MKPYKYNVNKKQCKIFSNFIPKNSLIFEVGSRDAADANHLKKIRPDIEIISFDPHPRFMELAKPFFESQIKIVPKAISETTGLIKFFRTDTAEVQDSCDDHGIGASSIKKPLPRTGLPTKSSCEITVESLRGDYACSIYGQPNVLILDVQGAEHEVLNSFEECLQKVLVIFTEANLRDGLVYLNDINFDKLNKFCERKGFVLVKAYNISKYSADLIFCRNQKKSFFTIFKIKTISKIKILFSKLKNSFDSEKHVPKKK
jgi:FkbM family methyltransferase